MLSKPKPVKVEKTLQDKLDRARWCRKHDCPKWVCWPSHKKPSKPKVRKPPKPKKQIRVKPKELRRKLTQTERTKLEAELDRLCSIYVRSRDKRCITCGSTKNLTCSHFIPRGNQYVRYDVEMNLNCQCAPCNLNHNDDESAYELYLLKKYGRSAVATLRAKSQITFFRWSVVELREMVKDIKEKLCI